MTSLPFTDVDWLYVKETKARKQITSEGIESLNNFPHQGFQFNKNNDNSWPTFPIRNEFRGHEKRIRFLRSID